MLRLLAKRHSLLTAPLQASLPSHSSTYHEQNQQQDRSNHNRDDRCCAHA
jgi:hypothetical protein